jgi:hypothetical protein
MTSECTAFHFTQYLGPIPVTTKKHSRAPAPCCSSIPLAENDVRMYRIFYANRRATTSGDLIGRK